jgi:hypothetical protein
MFSISLKKKREAWMNDHSFGIWIEMLEPLGEKHLLYTKRR